MLWRPGGYVTKKEIRRESCGVAQLFAELESWRVRHMVGLGSFVYKKFCASM